MNGLEKKLKSQSPGITESKRPNIAEFLLWDIEELTFFINISTFFLIEFKSFQNNTIIWKNRIPFNCSFQKILLKSKTLSKKSSNAYTTHEMVISIFF